MLYIEILDEELKEKIKVKREEDAGQDLFISKNKNKSSNHSIDDMGNLIKNEYDLFGGETKLFKTGIRASMFNEEGKPIMFHLVPRSSMYKKGIILANSIGIIDKGYRGELGAPILNTQKTGINITSDIPLLQIVRNSEKDFDVTILENQTLEDIDTFYSFNPIRREGGFGSTTKDISKSNAWRYRYNSPRKNIDTIRQEGSFE